MTTSTSPTTASTQPVAPPVTGGLTPVQPARPIASSASHTALEAMDPPDPPGPQKAAGGSVTRALMMAWAERLKQRPITQQKRWEAKKARALAHQIKEARAVNGSTPAGPGKTGSRSSGAGSDTTRKGSSTAGPTSMGSGTKPPPKAAHKQPSGPSGTSRNNSTGLRKSGPDGKPEARKIPGQQSGLRKSGPKDSGSAVSPRKSDRKVPEARNSGPETRRTSPDSSRKGQEKTRSQPGRDRKPDRKDPTGHHPPRKQPDKIRNDRIPGPDPGRKDSGPSRKVPEAARKVPEKVPPGSGTSRKIPDSRTPVRKPVPEQPERNPKPPEKPVHRPGNKPPEKTPAGVWKKTTQGAPPPTATSRRAPERKPEATPVKKGTTTPGPSEKGPVNPGGTTTAIRKKEDPLTTATDVQPVEVRGASASGVQLGQGASRASLTRGEIRTMKQLERYLSACVSQMQKSADETRAIRDKSVAEAKEARGLAERTRSVKGGQRLLPRLDRLAEQADLRAKKAEGIHKGALKAADLGKALLGNVQQRDGLIYQAVLDSPETEPAEMQFYEDRS